MHVIIRIQKWCNPHSFFNGFWIYPPYFTNLIWLSKTSPLLCIFRNILMSFTRATLESHIQIPNFLTLLWHNSCRTDSPIPLGNQVLRKPETKQWLAMDTKVISSAPYDQLPKTMCIAGSLEGFSGVDPAQRKKIGKENYEIRIDFFWVFVIFAGPTDTWRPAIDSFFVFFFFF